MKAAVLARGLARRMRAEGAAAPLTDVHRAAASAGLKAMMPVGPPVADGTRRPFLDYILSEIADAGAPDVALVVAPDHDDVRRWYEELAPPRRVRITYVVQPEAIGTANAVLACEAWADGDPFLVMNGDNLYPAGVLRPLVALGSPGLPAFRRADLVRSGHISAERVGAFALLDIDAHGHLRRIVEKPGADAVASEDARVSMNCWRFDETIFPPCRDVPRSPRGEFELPGAVGLAISRGLTFTAIPATGEILDLSSRSDVAEVARRLAPRRARP